MVIIKLLYVLCGIAIEFALIGAFTHNLFVLMFGVVAALYDFYLADYLLRKAEEAKQ